MKELIKITEQNGNRAVSARELHQYLETEDHFTQWAKRMFEYGFIKNIDYQAVHEFVKHSNGIGGTNKTDYALTIDTAKEIAMIQRTPKGKQARQYFIEMERVAMDKSLMLNSQQKYITGSIEHESSIIAKRDELMYMIKYYLKRGDAGLIANQLGCTIHNVRKVIYEGDNNKKVLKALHQRALENKQGLLFSYQEMIDELKR